MTLSMEFNEEELVNLVTEFVANSLKLPVPSDHRTNVRFRVMERRDWKDNPTGGHDVYCVVEIGPKE